MAMNVDYKGVEIGVLPANTSANFIAGVAVYLNTGTGKLDNPVNTARVLGLIKETNQSGVLNEVSGQYSIYGSGDGAVLCRGIATVQQSVYNGVSYQVYDQTKTYAYGDEIYATPGTGVLTNVLPAGAGPNGITSVRVGRVLKIPANPANGNPMQITVECA
jgi:hypothetical protein